MGACTCAWRPLGGVQDLPQLLLLLQGGSAARFLSPLPFLSHPQLCPPQPPLPPSVEVSLGSPALGLESLQRVLNVHHTAPGLLRRSGASVLLCLADYRALSVSANALSSPRGLWALGGSCSGLRRLGWVLGPRLSAGPHAPSCYLQESLDFPCRQRGGEIQLPGLGVGKQSSRKCGHFGRSWF